MLDLHARMLQSFNRVCESSFSWLTEAIQPPMRHHAHRRPDHTRRPDHARRPDHERPAKEKSAPMTQAQRPMQGLF